MKRVQHILLYFLFISVVFAGCNKNEPEPLYFISGTLRSTCGGMPVPNTSIMLHYDSGVQHENTETHFTTTNAEGRFVFGYSTYFPRHYSVAIDAPHTVHNKLLRHIPSHQNIELGDVFIQQMSTLYIKLNVINPYSAADTLYIPYAPGQIITVPGPFSSGYLDTVYREMESTPIYPEMNNNSYITWWINDEVNWYTSIFYPTVCSEAEMVINIIE